MEQLKVNIQKDQNDNLAKKSSIIASDGLLHRIAEEMYQIDKKGSTDNLIYRGKAKKVSNSTSKTTNPEIRMEKFINAASRNNNRKKVVGRD